MSFHFCFGIVNTLKTQGKPEGKQETSLVSQYQTLAIKNAISYYYY